VTPLSQFARLLRITRVFVRHDLDEFVRAVHLFRPYRLLVRALTFHWASAKQQPRGERLRQALEELGPIFVKFGQMLSTRPDLLPDDIALELARLQDQVPPFPGEDARRVVESSLGGPLDKFFRSFDLPPVASASVAQVHLAVLHDGHEVAVKVLRPGIDAVIERDLALLDTIARLTERWWPQARRFKPIEVVDEYRRTIHGELDLTREAANASRLRANFEHSPLLQVPAVYWDYTHSDVMVMERITGIPIGNVAELKRAGIDMKQLAHHGVEIFFTQAFRDGFFHADMHPGNIFVSPDGQYRAVDFGIMGSLSERDKHYLAENFLAFFNRDYRAVAEAHVRTG
jgi:ubiquinone biosynthesis protein